MLALKHIHMTLAIITLIGFLLRSFWMFTNNQLLEKRFVKVAPHIIDTLLLASGITFMIMTHQYPPTFSWLTVKILLIIAYIIFALKMFRAETKNAKTVLFLLAIGSFAAILYIARMKPLFW
ncbi:MAG: SirB2 family protein [Kangiellaceae bacterium]|nr:SirB2 family protein [Kangiellaceae bacterium]